MTRLHNISIYHRAAKTQRRKSLWFAFLIILISMWPVSPADAKVYIDIDMPEAKKLPIAIPSLHSAEGEAAVIASKVSEVITSDLEISGILNILDKAVYRADPL